MNRSWHKLDNHAILTEWAREVKGTGMYIFLDWDIFASMGFKINWLCGLKKCNLMQGKTVFGSTSSKLPPH